MSKIIESIDYFPAGYCSSQLGLMFKGLPNRNIVFPAGVFLLKHRKHGYILYDTGYSFAITRSAVKYFLYRLATPIEMKESDQIDQLLQQKGVLPSQISYIILSHLHPDHIGGAALFPQACFIITQKVYETYQGSRLKDLVFKEFLPPDFEQRLKIVNPSQKNRTFPYKETVDLFEDGSIFLASLDGHAQGQACLFLPDYQLFIAADLCWGIDLLPYTEQMRFLPLAIQQDKKSYLTSIALLERLLSDQIQVVVSHDPLERIRKILHG